MSAPGFAPIAVLDVELSRPLEPIPPTDAGGRRVGAARAMVRLHSRPLGVLQLSVEGDGVSASGLASAIWTELGATVNEHLRADSLPEISGIDERGLPAVNSPGCLARRENALRDGPTTSVIVCTRDRADMLGRTLRSLEAVEYPRVERIVVDGSTSSDTRRLVRELQGVEYVHVGENGLSVARNRGVAVASGSIVAFTDDDVVVDPNWLVELVAALDDERVACSTGLVVPLALETPAQLWFEESGAFTHGFRHRVVDLGMPRERGSLLPYATGRIGAGVNMAWRRSTLEELGGFDVAFDALTPPWPPGAAHGSSGEDLAAFFDALVAGFRIVFEPGAIVRHEHRRSYDELARQLYWHGLGLGAYLTRSLMAHPARIPDFARRVPRGVLYGFAPRSPRNREKSAEFPSGLTRAERRGVIHGPFAYLRGLPLARRIRRESADRSR